jgi:hypothetical protein
MKPPGNILFRHLFRLSWLLAGVLLTPAMAGAADPARQETALFALG